MTSVPDDEVDKQFLTEAPTTELRLELGRRLCVAQAAAVVEVTRCAWEGMRFAAEERRAAGRSMSDTPRCSTCGTMALSNYRVFCREILDDGGHADHRLCAACMLGMVNAVSRYDGSIVVQELESSCGDVVPLRIVVSR